MEKILPKQEITPPLHYTEEYYSDWDYNPGELLQLSVWHKKELPQKAIEKIKKALDDILGRGELPGQWTLDQREFENFVNGYSQCLTIPSEINNDLIEVMRQYKIKQSEKK